MNGIVGRDPRRSDADVVFWDESMNDGGIEKTAEKEQADSCICTGGTSVEFRILFNNIHSTEGFR